MSDCQKLVDILELIIDKEASAEQEQFFKSHIEGCAPCLDHYEIDEAMYQLIREKLEKKECKASLLDSIKSEINKI